MMPELFIYRRKSARRPTRKEQVYFVVVDGSKPKGFPSNFVCVLPNSLEGSLFRRVFGQESRAVAQKLLIEASRQTADPDILREIEHRSRLFVA